MFPVRRLILIKAELQQVLPGSPGYQQRCLCLLRSPQRGGSAALPLPNRPVNSSRR